MAWATRPSATLSRPSWTAHGHPTRLKSEGPTACAGSAARWCASSGGWVLHASARLARGSPAGVPTAEVSVPRHEFVPNIAAPNPPYVTFEVPVEVEDADGDQPFTAGDSIVFYAQSWWERSGL